MMMMMISNHNYCPSRRKSRSGAGNSRRGEGKKRQELRRVGVARRGPRRGVEVEFLLGDGLFFLIGAGPVLIHGRDGAEN